MGPTRQDDKAIGGIDPVEVAGEGSFPASDPPAWTPVTGVGPPPRGRPRFEKARGGWRLPWLGLLTTVLGVALLIWPEARSPFKVLGVIAIASGLLLVARGMEVRGRFGATEPSESLRLLRRSATDWVADWLSSLVEKRPDIAPRRTDPPTVDPAQSGWLRHFVREVVSVDSEGRDTLSNIQIFLIEFAIDCVDWKTLAGDSRFRDFDWSQASLVSPRLSE